MEVTINKSQIIINTSQNKLEEQFPNLVIVEPMEVQTKSSSVRVDPVFYFLQEGGGSYRDLSKKEIIKILKLLPFRYHTVPLNIPRNEFADHKDPLTYSVEVSPGTLIEIYPPNFRRMHDVYVHPIFYHEGKNSLVNKLRTDNVMDDACGGGFRCCFHPYLKDFGIRKRGRPADMTIEIDIHKFSSNDSLRVYKLLEKMNDDSKEARLDRFLRRKLRDFEIV